MATVGVGSLLNEAIAEEGAEGTAEATEAKGAARGKRARVGWKGVADADGVGSGEAGGEGSGKIVASSREGEMETLSLPASEPLPRSEPSPDQTPTGPLGSEKTLSPSAIEVLTPPAVARFGSGGGEALGAVRV